MRCAAATVTVEMARVEDMEMSDWLTQSAADLGRAIGAGEVDPVTLAELYLTAIAAHPAKDDIYTPVTPERAMAEAEAAKARADLKQRLGPLDGVPILLKDNIETLDPVATTAGSLALKDNVTGRDSPLVAGLRAQGAVILGKTNLSQWANFRSNDSMSGWSALGGQVRNPHMLDRNPCGSSSGSGAAAAASLAAGTVGTETNGSIICPSNVNGIVGFKPTVGLVAQDHIVPISSSQDTAGPMTKSVMGSARMLNAMATGDAKTDYVAALDAGSLSGQRIGVLRFAQGESADIQNRFNSALEILESQGATLVEIEAFSPEAENYFGNAFDVLQYEFKHTLNEYLASTPDAVTTRSLSDLIAFNKDNAGIELALFDQSIFDLSEAKGPITEEAYLMAVETVQTASRENGIDKLLVDYDVAMLVSPSGPLSPRIDPVNGDNWPAWAGAGYLAAIAGYPHITVPMGSVHGVPIGFSIMGAKDADADILSWGYAFEQASNLRVEPQYLPNAEARPEIAAAMKAK